MGHQNQVGNRILIPQSNAILSRFMDLKRFTIDATGDEVFHLPASRLDKHLRNKFLVFIELKIYPCDGIIYLVAHVILSPGLISASRRPQLILLMIATASLVE